MSETARGRLAPLLVATIALATSTPAQDAAVVDVPPLIWSVRGPKETDAARCLVLLAGRPHGQPAPRVSTLCLADGKTSVTELAPVNARSHVLSAEGDPDGKLRILVGRPGGIDEIRPDPAGGAARLVPLIEDEDLDPRWLGDRPDLDGDGRDDLLQATYQGISLWRRAEDGGMAPLPGPRLPPSARLDDEWMTLRGQFVMEPVPAAALRWTWPETIAGKRLRTYRVPLAGADPCAAWIDTETAVWVSRAVVLSGETPRLVALVRPADKFALFGNLTLLVAPLACDETARGSRPTQRLATEFDANIGWTNLEVTDVTGDGTPDVVVVARQGILDEKIQVAVYPGRAGGDFAVTPAAGSRSDLDPLAARTDDDLDGDGRLDLLVLDRTRVLLARGIAVRGAKDLPFDLRKAVFVPLPESIHPRFLLEPVDFDGDGRLEAIVAGDERKPGEKAGSRSAPAGSDSRIVIVPLPAPSR